MTAEEALNLPCPFAGQQRAYGVDQAASGTDQLGADVEQPLLERDDAVETLGRQSPATLGIAPPRPAARTGRVDQDQVRPAGPIYNLGDFVGWVEQTSFDPCACPFRSRWQF